MNAACLFVAGTLRALIPAPEFTLAWTHSVEKIRWEERYVVDADALHLVEARVQGSGAGMEPGRDATFQNGWWTWKPSVRPLSALRLTLSSYTRDYDLCWQARCRSLHDLVATAPSKRPQPAADEGEVVEIRACTRQHHE